MARFPAVDPEPPPLPLSARVRRAAAVGGAVLLVAVAAVVLPRAGSDPVAAPTPVPPAGRVVVVDGLALATTTPLGQDVQPLGGELALEPTVVDLVPSPDGRSAVLGTGRGFGASGLLVDLTGASPAVPAVPADLLAQGGLAVEPWADAGRSLVLERAGRVELVDRATGAVRSLGAGSLAVGDPTGPGAFVAAGGRLLPGDETVGRPPQQSVDAVELRTAGRPTTRLLSARDFAQLTGLDPTAPLVLDALSVSPDGSRVLVAGDNPQGGDGFAPTRAGAYAVFDRSGGVVAVRRSTTGRATGWVRWGSRDRVALGELVDTATINDPDRTVVAWDLPAAPVTIALPGALRGVAQEPCAWSPDAVRLVCGDDRGWFDVDAVAGTARAVGPVTGRPLLWRAS